MSDLGVNSAIKICRGSMKFYLLLKCLLWLFMFTAERSNQPNDKYIISKCISL